MNEQPIRPAMCKTLGCVCARWHAGNCVDSALRVLRSAPGTPEGIKIDYPRVGKRDAAFRQLLGRETVT